MSLLELLAIGVSLRVAISDLYARRVPNAWLLAAASGALLALLASPWWPLATPWHAHLLGAAIALLALLPFHLVRWMGAGDVKFFALLGLLLGWQALLPIWICASLAAGVHAVVVLLLPRLQLCLPRMAQLQLHALQDGWAARPGVQLMHAARQGRQGIPYAAYLAAAAIGWVLWWWQEGAP